MAVTKRIKGAHLFDEKGSGPVLCRIEYELKTDAAEAVAMGHDTRILTVSVEIPRADVVAMFTNAKVIDDGGWPEGALALPFQRKP